MNRKEYYITIFLSVFCLVLAFAAGYMFHNFYNPLELELPILSEANSALLENGFYPPPADPVLEYGMIRGMVQAYGDRFTSFLEPAQHELETDRLEGQFGGIGASMEIDEENNFILYPFPDSPAKDKGILDGDRLVKVDNFNITPETSVETILALIRGPVGDRIVIVIQRPPDNQEIEFIIRRKEIPTPSVTWHLAEKEPRLGVIRINVMGADTEDEIIKAENDLSQQGATHFVIDLRGNSGGYLSSGINIARLFLSDGIVIEEQYRGENVTTYKVTKPGKLADIPLAVLVGHNTASAAEITAGALQNHQRAVIIGTPTFGKDSIQVVVILSDGSSIHITSAKWWIPGLDFPKDGMGLIPDIPLPDNVSEPDPGMSLAIDHFFGETNP